MELCLAKEVLGEWNADHALEQKRILLPLNGEGTPVDVLVAFFVVPPGASLDQTVRQTGGEIERHLEAGYPALIYFSDARADLAEACAVQDKEWHELRRRYEARATIDSYADEKEFRAKFARQLDLVVGTHDYFKGGIAKPTPAAVEAPEPERELSGCARILLIEACEDFEGYLGCMKIGPTLRIQANGKQLVDAGKPGSFPIWEAAISELVEGGYLRDAGCNGQLYQIAPRGFEFLKSIGKVPVGYIAELGGM